MLQREINVRGIDPFYYKIICSKIKQAVKRATPVRTGNMKNHTEVILYKKHHCIVVRNTAIYAHYQDTVTRNKGFWEEAMREVDSIIAQYRLLSMRKRR